MWTKLSSVSHFMTNSQNTWNKEKNYKRKEEYMSTSMRN